MTPRDKRYVGLILGLAFCLPFYLSDWMKSRNETANQMDTYIVITDNPVDGGSRSFYSFTDASLVAQQQANETNYCCHVIATNPRRRLATYFPDPAIVGGSQIGRLFGLARQTSQLQYRR